FSLRKRVDSKTDVSSQPRILAVTEVEKDKKRLYRSRSEKIISGICGGIGVRMNLDPVIVRVIWILGTIATHGLGLVAYLLFLLIMPLEPLDGHSGNEDLTGEGIVTNG
ncbi:PspC domain-containing protein, partial [Calditrichota bacterium]